MRGFHGADQAALLSHPRGYRPGAAGDLRTVECAPRQVHDARHTTSGYHGCYATEQKRLRLHWLSDTDCQHLVSLVHAVCSS